MAWLLSLVVFVLDIWALIKTWSSSASTGTKVAWTIVILVLPVLGLVLWFLMGPKS